MRLFAENAAAFFLNAAAFCLKCAVFGKMDGGPLKNDRGARRKRVVAGLVPPVFACTTII